MSYTWKTLPLHSAKTYDSTTKDYSSTTSYYKEVLQYYMVLVQYYFVLQYYFVPQSTTPVLQSTTPVLPSTTKDYSLSRRKTHLLNHHYIWNLIYNAQSSRCHDPFSPNTAPVTQKDSLT